MRASLVYLELSVCEPTGTSILALAGRGAARRAAPLWRPKTRLHCRPPAPRPAPSPHGHPAEQLKRSVCNPEPAPKTLPVLCTRERQLTRLPAPGREAPGGLEPALPAAGANSGLRRSSRHTQLSNSSSHTTTYFIWICETS